jgi:hypothetical protein
MSQAIMEPEPKDDAAIPQPDRNAPSVQPKKKMLLLAVGAALTILLVFIMRKPTMHISRAICIRSALASPILCSTF